jgi:microcystin degradation protein MlrC
MKILMAGFYHESNTFSPLLTKKDEFMCAEGDELLEYFPGAVNAFNAAGVEIIPSTFVGKMSSGVIQEDSFRYLVNRILDKVESEKNLDGIWLQLHGAIYVEDIGCGELFLLRKLRKAVGFDIPIAVAMDPHGNLSPDITKYANIIRAYHTAPHVDQQDTYKVVAETLIDHINRGVRITPSFIRLPMLLCGDTALTSVDPLKSVIARFKELEKSKEICLASFFISFHSSDTDNTYPAVVIVPREEMYYSYSMDLAKEIADHIYSRRYEFDFEADLLLPEEAIEVACTSEETPVCISDSGDNTTAGATGMNTVFLRMFLERENLNGRKVLVSSIYDESAYKELVKYKVGDEVDIMVGSGIDEYSQPVRVKGFLKSKGNILLYLPIRKENDTTPFAGLVTVSVGDVDVVITEIADSFTDNDQFVSANLDPDEYDIIVVKQAYQFPDIVERAERQIMALSPGATYQDLPSVYYSKLPWTIFPFQK